MKVEKCEHQSRSQPSAGGVEQTHVGLLNVIWVLDPLELKAELVDGIS